MNKGNIVDPHGTLAGLRRKTHVKGVAGQFLLSVPVLGHYVLPNTHSKEVVAVVVRGYTGKDYQDRHRIFHVEVTFPGKKQHHLLPAQCVKLVD